MKLSRSRCSRAALLAAVLFSWIAGSSVAQEPRLANVSTLTRVGTGADVLTAGFVITGTTKKTVVIRGVGPRLASAPFNVPGTLADPQLTLFGPNSSSLVAASNNDWNPAQAAIFDSVGAFALIPGSKDAALVVDLDPGSYTAQVSGVGNTTGVAIVEVYEVTATGGKFVNLSTRAQVGGAASMLTPGFVVTAGSGTRKLLVRAAGPALAAAPFNLAGTLANPALTLTRSGTPPVVVATNDNWGSPVGVSSVPASVLSGAFAEAGAFPFAPGSNDAALLVDLAPGSYTVQVSGAPNTSGVAIVELYDLSPTQPVSVTVAATKPAADETGTKNGEFTFTRTGPTFAPLTLRYGVGGSAVNGFDYVSLPGLIVIPAGESSVALPLRPNPDLQNEGTDTVVVTVLPSTGYNIGNPATATVTIADSTATLYVANIRPETTATGSTGSGTATILLSSDGSVAAINLNVSNLSSAITSVHLRISPSGDFVFNLPYESSGSSQWLFAPVGGYSSTALLAALKSGNIFVGVDTARYPTGEVRGTFVQGAGSIVFTPPEPPPAVSLTNVTAPEAARFLTQATFGPKKTEIDALTGGSLDAWITQQMDRPFTSHRQATIDDRTNFGGSGSFTNWNAIHPPNRQAAWWKNVLTAPDQLRQRAAFALSELFVISEVSLGEDSHAEPLAHYYDQLGSGAFGNFRALLETVTLSPMMGSYLSSLRNAKATFATNGAVLTTPDENYAREVMQLFTIGLVQLQPDGRLILGADGLPIPTYTQKTITEMAKVFTGWAYPATNTTANAFRTSNRNYIAPMQLYPAFHDDTVKDLSPVAASIPAAQGGARDLQLALDALFNHPNTPPFVAKALIKRMVSSNPSPAYVYRVAQKFENNGAGVRGDLGAVFRAILTDYEARSPVVAANQSYGKLKEPILRLTAVLRGFNASASSGRFLGYRVTRNGTPITSAVTQPAAQSEIGQITSATVLSNVQGNLAQAALRSPTVFNFFSADYVLPGPLAAAGLVAPEFEITDDNFAISVPNLLRTFILATVPTTTAGPYTLALDLTYEQTLVSNPSALVDHLNLVLCAGNLPAAAKTRILAGLAALPAATSTLERAQSAVLLTLTSPAAATQK
jgi:uncharacterized protein (DUF1800 family)